MYAQIERAHTYTLHIFVQDDCKDDDDDDDVDNVEDDGEIRTPGASVRALVIELFERDVKNYS